MDPVTAAVRDQYDRFPYPEGSPVLRVCWDVRYLLSRVQQPRQDGARGLHALDAGCGRGLGLCGAAVTQPDVSFLGVDISATALEHARRHAAQLGLQNVRFAAADLMTLDGVAVPAGGFDVIYSSGVLHHLVDPAAGLARLAGVLAPHGVIQFMVYGRHGREVLRRFAAALKILLPADLPLAEQLAPARRLCAAAERHLFPGTPWAGSDQVGDVEFVDRFLNVNETDYDVPDLWDLAAGAGLHVVGWSEPADWDPALLVDDPELKTRLRALPSRERFRLVELLTQRPKLECLLAHAANPARKPPRTEDLQRSTFVVNPDVTFSREVRNLRAAQRTESLRVRIRAREPRALRPGPEARGGLLLAGQAVPFTGEEFIQALAKEGVKAGQAETVLAHFLTSGVVYRPHPVDI